VFIDYFGNYEIFDDLYYFGDDMMFDNFDDGSDIDKNDFDNKVQHDTQSHMFKPIDTDRFVLASGKCFGEGVGPDIKAADENDESSVDVEEFG
jgi:hypothetical protein